MLLKGVSEQQRELRQINCKLTLFSPIRIEGQDRVSFAGKKESAEKNDFTFKQRMTSALSALKAELKRPASCIFFAIGSAGLVLLPLALLSSAFFPAAVPVLWPMAAGTSWASGVVVWEAYKIMKPAYQKPTTAA